MYAILSIILILIFIYILYTIVDGPTMIAMKSPTNNAKINLDDACYVNIGANSSPPRVGVVKNSNFSNQSHSSLLIEEDISNSIISYLDSELNELTELEVMLCKIKTFDQIRIPFGSTSTNKNECLTSQAVSSSKVASNKPTPKSSSKQNILVKKKYQILGSVTIDLINNTTSSNSIERSKSKKGK
jgi:hypothetical protein